MPFGALRWFATLLLHFQHHKTPALKVRSNFSSLTNKCIFVRALDRQCRRAKRNDMKAVRTLRNEKLFLQNENLSFAKYKSLLREIKWKSAFCEMKSVLCEMKICTLRNGICTLRNENLYFAK